MKTPTCSCPICESNDIATVGPILHPQPTLIAGVEVDLGDTPYCLERCPRCQFQFKWPMIPEETLLACYAGAKSSNWETDPDPISRKFDELQALLNRHTQGDRILDVGCFNGAFLNFLDSRWKKYGVEPSGDAAQLARSRGVTVLGRLLEDIPRDHSPFDAVIAIDVVEHLARPLDFFRRASELVAPGGVLVILTGDTRSLAWRLQGSMYWYCSLPEHVSFYNRDALDFIGTKIGMRGVEYRQLSHGREPLTVWVSDMAKSAAYIIGRRAKGFGIPTLKKWFVQRRGPSVRNARDHLVYVYRKD